MKEKLGIVSVIISIAAISISIYAAFACDKRIEADWLGILVGILSLLVTATIGINIYTLVDFNRATKEVKELKNTMHINVNASLAISSYDTFTVYHYLITNKDPLSIEYRYIHSGLACLSHLSKICDHQNCNVVVKSMLESLTNTENITISSSSKEELLLLLSEVQQSRLIKNFHELARRIALIQVDCKDG